MIKFFILIIFLLPPLYLIYMLAIYLVTKVFYLSTQRKYFAQIFKMLKIKSTDVIYDLGCGKGNLLFAWEKLGAKNLIGFELSPWHAWVGQIRAKIKRLKVKIYHQNFFKADLSHADIIYLFLVKSVLVKLWPKIKKEVKKGTVVAVLSDQIPGVDFVEAIELETGIYLYKYII